MNKKLAKEIFEKFRDCGETECAEIFNIYANDPERLSWGYDNEEFVFNIMDKRQAAKAVSMFGFKAVADASQDDWIIRAKKNDKGEWKFSNVAPSVHLEAKIEDIILDILWRPRDYPAWVWELIQQPLTNYLSFND